MKVRADQFSRALAQGLPTAILLSGDEPQQKLEALDATLALARQAGLDERLRFDIDNGFDWNSLIGEWQAPSLFAPRRLFDLRLNSLRLPKDAAAWLAEAASEPAGGNVLILSAPRLEAAQKKAPWVQAIERHGLWLEVWPLKEGELLAWMERRLRQHGLVTEPEALQLLAERVEGNLLAAAQEIAKLALLNPQGQPAPLHRGDTPLPPIHPERVGAACGGDKPQSRRLTPQDILAAVGDASRHSVFDLSEAILRADARRALRVLQGLQGEGEDPILLAWVLTREIRLIADLATRLEHGEPLAQAQKALKLRDNVMRHYSARARLGARHWQGLLLDAARLDRINKGLAPGRPWPELTTLTLRACQTPRRR